MGRRNWIFPGKPIVFSFFPFLYILYYGYFYVQQFKKQNLLERTKLLSCQIENKSVGLLGLPITATLINNGAAPNETSV